jgi:hypothetical protein
MHRAMSAFFELGASLEKKFSKEALDQARKVLDDTANRLEEIDRKLKGSKNE